MKNNDIDNLDKNLNKYCVNTHAYWLFWIMAYISSGVASLVLMWSHDSTWLHNETDKVVFHISWAIWAWAYTTYYAHKVRDIIKKLIPY